MTGEPDFWKASGYSLLEHGATGERLRVTDDFLRAYFVRPEMLPPEAACANERRLHASLLDQPGRPVTETELAALADPDAVDNYRVILNFRDQLLPCRDIESAYLQLIQRTNIGTPPLFLDHLGRCLVHEIGVLQFGPGPHLFLTGALQFLGQAFQLCALVYNGSQRYEDLHGPHQGGCGRWGFRRLEEVDAGEVTEP